MTAPVMVAQATCPKCQGVMWDNRGNKTNPKQPDFKCQNKACAHVIWPPKGSAPPVAKSNEKKPVSLGHPGFLDGAEAEDKAELDAKLAGVDTSKLQKDLALYLSISEWVVKNVGPIYADGIGWSPESATAAVATIFIQAKRNQ